MRYKALVIDDDSAIRKALKVILRTMDWYMLEAREVPEAVGKVLADPDIKLVVVDYQMPGMNGIEFVEVLRDMEGSARETKVLMMSGVASEEQKLAALAAGVDVFLAKPFNSSQFRGALQELGLQMA
ncbi:MAG: response regulator [Mariprofundales bacterium]|nr:response regulator [Mariprofundales bacterium]